MRINFNVVLIVILSCLGCLSCSDDDGNTNPFANELAGEYYLSREFASLGGEYLGELQYCEDYFLEFESNGLFKHGIYETDCDKDYFDTDLDPSISTWEYLGQNSNGFHEIELVITGGVVDILFIETTLNGQQVYLLIESDVYEDYINLNEYLPLTEEDLNNTELTEWIASISPGGIYIKV